MASGVTGTGELQWLTILMGIFALASPFVIFAITGVRSRTADLETKINGIMKTVADDRALMEQRLATQLQRALETHAISERTIWAAIDADRSLAREFREKVLSDMVTKRDLVGLRTDLKDHITAAINNATARRTRSTD